MISWLDVIKALQLFSHCPGMERMPSIRGFYCGDMMSDVLARAGRGDVWLTIQRHQSVVAVASLVGISGIIITGGRQPLPETVALAQREGIPLFSTHLNSFQAAGRAYRLLLEAGWLEQQGGDQG
ncbi:MAG: DRTGG domain-containing protein [Desulfurispora sp.]|uniref:DRTGG domain-containing protein n=1 Tax=Desulfurispora sp. TaxID=3014275 RepID=UPI0040494A84